MKLDSSVTELKGVGAELTKKLSQLGIKTVSDLLHNYPRKYEDYSNVVSVSQLRPGPGTIQVTIGQLTSRYVRRGLHITEAIASDTTGSVRLVWFNQPYRAESIRHGHTYFVAGEYGLRRGRFSILNPSVELASNFPVNTARIIPIYREVKGLRSLTLRKIMREVIQEASHLEDTLPKWLVQHYKLMAYANAVHEIHFPSSSRELERARRRLGFEEIFYLTLAALVNKQEFTSNKALSIPFNETLARDFVAKLPFKLTNAQRKVVWRIYQDMAKTMPMNRLIEGDVGSGKTVVAAMAALMAIEQDFQAAFMAPTEILATQHASTLSSLLDSVGYGQFVGLLVGGLRPKQKQLIQSDIAKGDIKLVVGTHALISENVDMHKLGLVVIDEQHRFGVEQRKKLQAKAGHMPHVLHMTATPIPRSLALTLYGELDISLLDEMPAGRQAVITKIVSPLSRDNLNKKVDQEIAAGRQVFVVCPVISAQNALTDDDWQTASRQKGMSAEEIYERLSQKDFKHRRVGLLHGRMKSAEKEAQMAKFLKQEYDILVSTTVIEVGVDVPNATTMVVEGAERFGLAQIHQLRGRVGRGQHQSFCYLIPSSVRSPIPRLRALETTSDGFKLAEMDLQIRGPGAIYGTLQHGALDLRVAKLSDIRLIAGARSAAQAFLDREDFKKYPLLKKRIDALRSITNLN